MDRNLLEKNYIKANNQLINIDCRKSKLKKEVYSIYDLYLKIVRSKLQLYIGESIKALVDVSNNGISDADQKTKYFIKNDLAKLLNKFLPFFTIEQLSIKKDYKVDNQIKNSKEFKNKKEFKNSYYLREEANPDYKFQNIQEIDSTNYCYIYYKDLLDEDKFKTDNLLLEGEYYNYSKIDENLELINSTILLNDSEESKLSININQCKNSNYFIPIEFKDILIWLDTIESSLNFYLKELSFEINNQLFKENILKRFINNDLLLYIFENNLLFSNPLPFILAFDPSLNQFVNFEAIYSEKNFSKIHLINIDSAELEYINFNLNNLKNKLLKYKSNIHLLIKKENYWCNKLKSHSNYKSKVNKS